MSYQELNESTRGRLIGMMEAGSNVSEVSRRLRISRSTVRYWWHRWQQEGNINRQQRPGRPTVMTTRMQRSLRVSIVRNPWQTYQSIRHGNLTLQVVSRRTINRNAIAMGFRARRPVQRIQLTPLHRQRRYQWCLTHGETQWNEVAFSDESRFSLDFNDGRQRVRRLTGTGLNDNLISQHHRSGGGSIMVWGAITKVASRVRLRGNPEVGLITMITFGSILDE